MEKLKILFVVNFLNLVYTNKKKFVDLLILAVENDIKKV